MAINFLWFAAAGSEYLGWYVDNGAIIALVFAVVVVAVDFDRHPSLIAADPYIFVAGVVELIGDRTASLSPLLEQAQPDRALAERGVEVMQSRFRWLAVDRALAYLFTLILLAAMLAWALVVAPLQYWVNLVCGAPARMSLASSRTVWLIRDAHHIEYRFAPKDPEDFPKPEDARELEEARERGRATELTFATKPVTFTSTIAAAFLWAVARFV